MAITSVKLSGVTKRYGDLTVIPDLSLELAKLHTTAIVGESGSGKSTILQLINGLVQPEQGLIYLDGQALDYQGLAAIRRRMGYAVQGAGLFPHLTVRDNVALVARLEGWSDAEVAERMTELFELLNLAPEFEDRYPTSLSGGQQQRVSLCRAMMLNPPLLLLDEPFSALDPITRRGIYEEFLRLQAAERRTIVLVTHDINEALKLAQNIVILKEGVVVQQGSVAEVRESPGDDYVKGLLSLTEAGL